ncbi:MAG: hypothetical protein ACLT4D_04520 [Blautia faecis]
MFLKKTPKSKGTYLAITDPTMIKRRKPLVRRPLWGWDIWKI